MRLLTFFAAAAMLSASLAARADTVQTLYVNATFQDGDKLSGTLVYDLGLHFVIGGDVTLTGLYNETWTDASSTPNSHGTSTFNLYNVYGSMLVPPVFEIEYMGDGLPVPFTPITICSLTNPCADFGNPVLYTEFFNDIAVSGYVTPIAPTPEPSSLALLGTGMLGIAGMVRKRFM